MPEKGSIEQDFGDLLPLIPSRHGFCMYLVSGLCYAFRFFSFLRFCNTWSSVYAAETVCEEAVVFIFKKVQITTPLIGLSSEGH